MSKKSNPVKRQAFACKPNSSFSGFSKLDPYSPIMKMARDHILAEKFLNEAGIIIKAGILAPEYDGSYVR